MPNPTRWILWDVYVNEERGPLDLDGVRAYLVGLDAVEVLTPENAEGRDLAIAALDAGELGRLVELAAGLDLVLEEYVEPEEPEIVHMCRVVEVRRADACGDLVEVVTIGVVPEIDAILAEDGDDR